MDQITVKQFDVRPVMNRAYCPDCDVELEREDNLAVSTFPPTYYYFCPKCGYGYQSRIAYPTVDFVSIDDDAIES